MSRRESVGRVTVRTQSSSGPPVQQTVSVAVLPPRLPPGMAPPTRVGAADVFDWDESLNWVHNEPIDKDDQPVSKRKQVFRKAGLTTQRKKANPDVPPFILRQVPYETWRKHYAKDKDGNYQGTHAPAEDCLLKPDDLAKWRISEPVTKGDKWTRGQDVLPVYSEIKDTHALPEYQVDYDGPPSMEPVISTGDEEGSSLHTQDSLDRQRTPSSTGPVFRQSVADGKTAEEIIAEAKAKPPPKRTLRQWIEAGVAGTMGPS